MVAVLQLSDLHRSSEDPVGNSELLAALESDRVRWPAEAAGGPDLIVVSGDVIQGVPLDTMDSADKLDQQYGDAGELLGALADRFLGSDRSRLVLVPGNHDVDWVAAREAMEQVSDEDLQRLSSQLPWNTLKPASHYRWSWRDRKLFRIIDPDRYRERCARFLEFRREFYAGVSPDPLRLDPDLIFMEFPNLDLSITGFSSWYGNDCYCLVGAIDPDLLARGREAIAASSCALHLAVWHHSTAGPPEETDFLDVNQIHKMIDYGYRVGLHGHHHRTDATVMSLRLPTREEFALVSAGSLAAGRRELPVGHHRQYSVLEIDPPSRRLKVHVREAISDLIFTQSKRTELGGESFVELAWTASPGKPPASHTVDIDDAYRAYAEGDLERALQLLRGVEPLQGPSRRLYLDVLAKAHDWQTLAEELAAPSSADELILAVDAHCRLGQTGLARAVLESGSTLLQSAPDIRAQLEARIALKEITA